MQDQFVIEDSLPNWASVLVRRLFGPRLLQFSSRTILESRAFFPMAAPLPYGPVYIAGSRGYLFLLRFFLFLSSHGAFFIDDSPRPFLEVKLAGLSFFLRLRVPY